MKNRSNLFLMLIIFILSGASGCSSDEAKPDVGVSNDDGKSCEKINLSFTADVTASECGDQTGTLIVRLNDSSLTGVKYAIGELPAQSSNEFANISGGIQNVIVSTTEGCELVQSITVPEVVSKKMTFETVASACDSKNGSIKVAIDGEDLNAFQFSIDSESNINGDTFSNLAAGDYTITATKNNGCKIIQIASVPAMISFSGSIASLIETNCATNASCHKNTSNRPNYSEVSVIKENSKRILARVVAGTMPPGSPLTTDEIESIECWVNGGSDITN